MRRSTRRCDEVSFSPPSTLTFLSELRGASCHFLRRDIFNVCGKVPGKTKWIFEASRPVSVKLIGNGPGNFCPGRHCLRKLCVDIQNVEVQQYGTAADRFGA